MPIHRVHVEGYEAGHTAYLGEDSIQVVTDGIYAFIKGGNPAM